MCQLDHLLFLLGSEKEERTFGLFFSKFQRSVMWSSYARCVKVGSGVSIDKFQFFCFSLCLFTSWLKQMNHMFLPFQQLVYSCVCLEALAGLTGAISTMPSVLWRAHTPHSLLASWKTSSFYVPCFNANTQLVYLDCSVQLEYYWQLFICEIWAQVIALVDGRVSIGWSSSWSSGNHV